MSILETKFINKLINQGLTPTDSPETIRIFRQANILTYSYIFFAFTIGLLFAISSMYRPFVVQILFCIIYICSSLLIRYRRISLAKNIIAFGFEIQIFVIWLLIPTQDINSNFGVVLAIYPLLSALLEISIWPHTIIAILQNSFFVFQQSSVTNGTFNIVFTAFLQPIAFIMIGTIINIVTRENKKSRKEIQKQAIIREDMAIKMQEEIEARQKDIESRTQAIQDREIAEKNLRNKIQELETLNKHMVDRELKMTELKKRIQELENLSSIQTP
jgi:hypothetical protein